MRYKSFIFLFWPCCTAWGNLSSPTREWTQQWKQSSRTLLFLLYVVGTGTPLQYSCLENPMDGGAWWAAVHAVAKSRTQLSNFTCTFPVHALEKEMATHSSVLAWRSPGTGEPGGLPSMGSHRVRHNCSDLAVAYHLFNSMTSWCGRQNNGTTVFAF